jgi:hypothetical protein
MLREKHMVTNAYQLVFKAIRKHVTIELRSHEGDRT